MGIHVTCPQYCVVVGHAGRPQERGERSGRGRGVRGPEPTCIDAQRGAAGRPGRQGLLVLARLLVLA